ncbi:hypothetical protein PBI_ARISSANAE_64 [Mycobacterium phage Arissanae]|nr:hypothetical protein PBI_ARISSANAE_64 [Mycobacterium phage Arissanae]
MTLSIKILGFEVASVDLDLGEPAEKAAPVLDRGIAKLSRWWVNRGMSA